MGPKSIRDGDSPSTSAFPIPQLRHSRRGSLASLSSANQLDKETLSQALDQIHSTASQTETLTTFNEYTSPPTSSSGPDTKGIASELQGGLSGLYSRLRASVGNFKDTVNSGNEDVAVENPPLKSPRAATYSPKAVSKNGLDSVRSPSSSISTTQVTSATESGRQSPLGNMDTDGERPQTQQSLKVSTKSLGSPSTSAKSVTGPLAGLNLPPVTLTQAAQLTTISPAVADVNISAVKRINADVDPVSIARNTTLAESQRLSRNSQRPSHLGGLPTQGGVNASDFATLEGSIPRNASQSSSKQQKDGPVLGDASGALQLPGKPGVAGYRAASTDSVRPFPELEDEYDETSFAATSSLSAQNDPHSDRPVMVVTNYSKGQDDVFNDLNSSDNKGTLVDNATNTGRGLQHIKLPLRKTMAPPLVTRSLSSNLSPSRASTSDTESLDNPPLLTIPTKLLARSNGAFPIRNDGLHSLASARTHRDPRTMNVFSQVKNKLLNKEYWMKDENARDCFYCGDSFSTFRRKHHCSKSYCSCSYKLFCDLYRDMWSNI